MKTILILASNPKGTSVLDLDREFYGTQEGLRRSQNQEQSSVKHTEQSVEFQLAMSAIAPSSCGFGDR